MYVGGVNETYQICGKFSLKVFTFIFLPESFEMLLGGGRATEPYLLLTNSHFIYYFNKKSPYFFL